MSNVLMVHVMTEKVVLGRGDKKGHLLLLSLGSDIVGDSILSWDIFLVRQTDRKIDRQAVT